MKKFILLSMLFFSVAILQAQVTNGLIAYYPLNGNANDASGRGHNGTVHNATLTSDRYGFANSAFAFNGTNAIIEIPDHSDFHMTNFTISAWVNANNVSQTFVSKSFGSSYFNSYTIGYDYTSLASAVTDGVNSFVFTSGTPLPSNWFHYAVSFDDANDVLKFYTNGILVSTISTPVSLAYDNSIVTIGGEYNSGVLAYMTSGILDEVRIYNRALSEKEIDALAHPAPLASIANKTLIEGNSETSLMKLKVTLNHPSDRLIKITYNTIDNTAKAGSDYVAKQGTLSFQPGQTSKTIPVTINGDLTPEANERFNVLLSQPSNVILADDLGIGTIKNDDVSTSKKFSSQAADKNIMTSSITLSPNPAKDVIRIAGLNNNLYAIAITDATGRTVLKQTLQSNNQEIDISKLSPGYYFILITQDGVVQSLKFVKM